MSVRKENYCTIIFLKKHELFGRGAIRKDVQKEEEREVEINGVVGIRNINLHKKMIFN